MSEMFDFDDEDLQFFKEFVVMLTQARERFGLLEHLQGDDLAIERYAYDVEWADAVTKLINHIATLRPAALQFMKSFENNVIERLINKINMSPNVMDITSSIGSSHKH